MKSTQPVLKKRKTLHDFSPKATAPPPRQTASPDDHKPLPTTVPGVSIFLDFMTAAEEAAILTFLSAQQWRTDLSRRTIHYGGTYCLMPPRDGSPEARKRVENNVITAPPAPTELTVLVDRMVSFGIYTSDQKAEYIVVNEYLAGQGISAHVENFRFHEPVCGLTLGDGDHIRFHELAQADDGSVRSGRARRAKRTGRKVDVWMPSCSLLVMRGAGRWKWQHEIVRGRKKRQGFKRTSLTFRVEKRGRHSSAALRQ